MKNIDSELKVVCAAELNDEIINDIAKANIDEQQGKKIIEEHLNGANRTTNHRCNKKSKSKIEE